MGGDASWLTGLPTTLKKTFYYLVFHSILLLQAYLNEYLIRWCLVLQLDG